MTAGVRREAGLDWTIYWVRDCSEYLYCHTTKMQQIKERMLAEMKAGQEKIKAEIRANS
jgi:hypothetical protein